MGMMGWRQGRFLALPLPRSTQPPRSPTSPSETYRRGAPESVHPNRDWNQLMGVFSNAEPISRLLISPARQPDPRRDATPPLSHKPHTAGISFVHVGLCKVPPTTPTNFRHPDEGRDPGAVQRAPSTRYTNPNQAQMYRPTAQSGGTRPHGFPDQARLWSRDLHLRLKCKNPHLAHHCLVKTLARLAPSGEPWGEKSRHHQDAPSGQALCGQDG